MKYQIVFSKSSDKTSLMYQKFKSIKKWLERKAKKLIET